MIISIINQKGGVGKTTTAVNVAVCAAQHQKVLLVDLDPQGNATSGVGLREIPRPTLYEALVAATSNAATADSATTDAAEDSTANFHTGDANTAPDASSEPASHLTPRAATGLVADLSVIGTSPELAGSEIDLAGNNRRDDLRRVLTPLRNEYPLIIVDTPPSLSLLTINALVAADFLIIPVQCEYFALEGLGHLLRTLELIKRSLNPDLRVLGLVRTMYNNRLGLSSQVSEELKRHFPQLLFETIIPRNVRLAEAPSYGQPITLYDRRSPGADAYRRLTVEILQRLGATYHRAEARYIFAN